MSNSEGVIVRLPVGVPTRFATHLDDPPVQVTVELVGERPTITSLSSPGVSLPERLVNRAALDELAWWLFLREARWPELDPRLRAAPDAVTAAAVIAAYDAETDDLVPRRRPRVTEARLRRVADAYRRGGWQAVARLPREECSRTTAYKHIARARAAGLFDEEGEV